MRISFDQVIDFLHLMRISFIKGTDSQFLYRVIKDLINLRRLVPLVINISLCQSVDKYLSVF